MSNTKKHLLAVTGVVLIIIISFFVLFIVQTKCFGLFSPTKKESVSLYFLDSTLSKLSKEEQVIKEYSGDKLYNIVNLLIKGPENTVENKRAIPENAKILSITRKGSLAIVDFSSEFNSGSTANDMLAAFTVVYSLCGVDTVEQVSILVNGEPLVDTDKKALGALGKDDIVNEGDQVKTQNTVELTLYFPNSDYTKLVRETRQVALNDNISKAQLIITELMNDSSSGTHDTLIPKSAKLSSVEIKDFTCFVNFSKEFLEDQPQRSQGSDANAFTNAQSSQNGQNITPNQNMQTGQSDQSVQNEIITIYAIVNSLTELDEIRKVQFLIDGQKVENFGSVVFSQPFERNENVISK